MMVQRAACLIIFFLSGFLCQAQQCSIFPAEVSYCANGQNVYVATGASAAIDYWEIQGLHTDIIYLTNDKTTISFSWTGPTTSAYVRAVLVNGQSCTTNTFAVSAAVTPDVSISPSTVSISAGTAVTFTATPTNGGSSPWYVWYLNDQIIQTGSSNTYTNVSLQNGDKVYVVLQSSVQCRTTTTDPTSNKVTASVSYSLNPPAVTQVTAPYVYNATVSLPVSGAAAGEDYRWYDAQSGGNFFEGLSHSITIHGTTTYYVSKRNTSSGAESIRVPQTVTVTVPAPDSPTLSPNTCGARTLTRTTPPANVTWYWQGTNPNGTDMSYNGTTYTIQEADAEVYYLRARINDVNNWSIATGIEVTTDPVDIVVNNYQPVIRATHSIELGSGFSVPPGGSFSANIVITSECNDQYNWSEQIVYDEQGNPSARSRTYVDGLGNVLQSQAKDYGTQKVWVSQPLYDDVDNPSASTLSAPIQESDFIIKNNFVLNNSLQPYSAPDFDAGSTRYDPAPVNGSKKGTLGWYYSSNNDLEPATPTTSFPYARTYTDLGPDPVKSISAGAGDQYKMGSTHEISAERQMFIKTELANYFSLRNNFVHTPLPSSIGENSPYGYKYIDTSVDGKRTISFEDADGNTLATAVISSPIGSPNVYDYWNYYYYNDLGQLVASITPEGVVHSTIATPVFFSTYKYDELGRLIETTTPDGGTSRFVYNTDGQMRFSENQLQRQAVPPRFSYTNYDYLGRLVESGEYTSQGADAYVFEPHTTLNPSAHSVLNIVDAMVPAGAISELLTSSNYAGISKALDYQRCSDYTFIQYDLPAFDLSTNDPDHSIQNNLLGEISKTKNENASTWYSYDEFGQLEWSKQHTSLGDKTIDYTYDYYGNVTQVLYQKNQPDQFYHHYTYDVDQRLANVQTSVDGSNKTQQAKYYYYLHGPLKRVELANNLQGIDYTYTLQGALKSINHMDNAKDPGADGQSGDHADFSPDVFGLTLDYFDNDYVSAGTQYNPGTITTPTLGNNYGGTLRSVSWFTPVDNDGSKHSYSYTYDNINQLKNAQWGSVTGSNGSYLNTPNNSYREGVGATGYDKNGNIQSLIRTDKSGSNIANYTYNYDANTDKLDKVNDNGSVMVDYTYDAIGRLTTYVEDGNTFTIQYDAYENITQIKKDGVPIESFLYDDRGDKIQTVVYDQQGIPSSTTYYVRDVSGTVVATYVTTPSYTTKLTELPVYGAGRIGVYKPGATTLYEINDHLGNVRAVIGASFTETTTATMETDPATVAREDKQFRNLQTRGLVSSSANHTPNGNSAAYVDGAHPTGPVTYRKVAAGDVISIDVYSYYQDVGDYDQPLDPTVVVNSIISAFGVSATSTGDPGRVFNGLSNAFNGGGALGVFTPTDKHVPAAGLNMIMFDNDYKTDPAVQPMSSVMVSDANNLQHLTIGPITIPQPGYVYIYINSNSNSQGRIYFDDLKVTHLHSPFVAGGDFYPYGLPIEDRQIKIDPYRHGYQGQYAEQDSVTGWNHFTLRSYDPRIGRWISMDPYGQYASPYVAMGNIPHMGVDPDGGFCCGEAMEDVYAASIAEVGMANADAEILKFAKPDLSLGYATRAENLSMKASLHGAGMGSGLPRFDEFAVRSTSAASIGSESIRNVSTEGLTQIAVAEPSFSFSMPSAETIQDIAGVAGMIPGLNTIAGVVEAGAALYRGDYMGAAFAAAGAIPFVGSFAAIGKVAGRFGKLIIQSHHVIPRAVIRDFGLGAISGFSKHGLRNIKRIPIPFHGWHPQYNRYVARQLEELRKLGPITVKELNQLQNDLKREIRKAYKVHKTNGTTLNEYFRHR